MTTDDLLLVEDAPARPGFCSACYDEPATTDCGAPHEPRCPLCRYCRSSLDGTDWDDAPETPAEGARLAEPKDELSRPESAPALHIVPSAGLTLETNA